MNRILIIGCGGSGKSTLARALGKKLGIPVTHLDQLWWKPGWEENTTQQFDEKLAKVLATPSWIIDGNYSRTMEMRLEKCDTIIYLDFSRWACLWGMLQRVIGGYGKTRSDMTPGCPERLDLPFIKWIWGYNAHNRVRNYTWIAKARHAKAVVLKNRKEVNKFLASLDT